jgi:tRNA nucleotidyltransferase (CCA-adding enzyme)
LRRKEISPVKQTTERPVTDREKALKLRPPKAVLEITQQLEHAGFQAWCVGGAVRDALLGHPHLDWDLATDATPDQVTRIFGRKRTIPKGIKFGTVGILDGAGGLHEVTTFRRDVRTDGRHADVEFGASLDEDLARRDFTINAIAYSPKTERIHDPFEGQADLERRVVRAVGKPVERMREDRLRALRAIRFAARLDFEIDAPTWAAVQESAPHLTRLSSERVREEIEKTMQQVGAPSRAFARWRESGALRALIPELAEVSDETLAALDHTAQPGLETRPGRGPLRVAVLLSDVPAVAALATLTRLRFSNGDAQWIAGLVSKWQALGGRIEEALRDRPADAKTVRRWIADIGRLQLGAFYRLAEARWSARRAAGARAPTAQAVHGLYRRSLRAALSEPVDLRDLAIDGDDLREAGIAPGPGMGRILSALLDLVLDDPRLNTRDRLLDEARRLHSGPR